MHFVRVIGSVVGLAVLWVGVLNILIFVRNLSYYMYVSIHVYIMLFYVILENCMQSKGTFLC